MPVGKISHSIGIKIGSVSAENCNVALDLENCSDIEVGSIETINSESAFSAHQVSNLKIGSIKHETTSNSQEPKSNATDRWLKYTTSAMTIIRYLGWLT